MAIIRLVPKGDYALINGKFNFVEGAEHTKNRIAQRFKFFRGEWFADLRQGIPYRRDVLVKNPNLVLVKALFQRVLKTTPGVKAIQRSTLTVEKATRRLIYDWEVIGTNDERITGQHVEFLVNG
jgi:hypothetical protein